MQNSFCFWQSLRSLPTDSRRTALITVCACAHTVAHTAQVRKNVIGCILATDMTHHFDMVNNLDSLFERLQPDLNDSGEDARKVSPEDMQLMLNLLVHTGNLNYIFFFFFSNLRT
jgi:hypothetical protein